MDAGRHPNITLLSYSEVEEVAGYVGNFDVRIRKRARSVREDLCTGCGLCQEKCPRRVLDTGFEAGMAKRKAVYRPFGPNAAPNKRGIGLTVCPVSNRFVVQSLTAKEIRSMLQKGMKATVNSDDPAYFRAYMNGNFIALQQEGEFSKDEIVQLSRNAFDIAWLVVDVVSERANEFIDAERVACKVVNCGLDDLRQAFLGRIAGCCLGLRESGQKTGGN